MLRDYNGNGLDAASLTDEHIGFVGTTKFGGSVYIEEVIVQENGGNASLWNVQLDGRDVFSQTQSVTTGTTPETFIPDQNRSAAGSNLELALTKANQESGSQTLDVDVVLNDQQD